MCLGRTPSITNKARWKLDSDSLKDVCLLVIDAQKKYLHNTTAKAALPHISALIQKMKEKQGHVYWTQFSQVDGYNTFPGEAHYDFKDGGETKEQVILPGHHDIIPEIHPDAHGLDRERIFPTNRYSSFTNAELADRLRSHTSVIICGGWSDYCVLATSFDAIDNNIKVVVASDAIFTNFLERNVWAQKLIGFCCGRVETTRDILQVLV